MNVRFETGTVFHRVVHAFPEQDFCRITGNRPPHRRCPH